MKRSWLSLLGLGVVLSAATARATSDADASAARAEGTNASEERSADAGSEDDKSLSHFMQLGLRTSIVGGYRMIFRYDDSPFCAEPVLPDGVDEQQKICGHMGPAMLDVAASFAPIGPIEPFIMMRLGLVGEAPTDTKPLKMVALGSRIYTHSRHALKLFIEPSLGVELEGGGGDPLWTFNGAFDPQYRQDIIFRVGIGPQLDLARNVGIYAQVFGMSVGILRYIHGTLEFGGGLQVRFP